VARVPHWLTLTATIAGRPAAGSFVSTAARIFASVGQRLRQSGSMNVRRIGRPLKRASETGLPV